MHERASILSYTICPLVSIPLYDRINKTWHLLISYVGVCFGIELAKRIVWIARNHG